MATVINHKQELINTIKGLDESDSLVKDALNYIKKRLKKENIPAPCQYSAQELKERAAKAIQQMEQGLGISHEEMKKRHPVL